MMSIEEICRDVGELFNEERLREASIPSVLHIAFVKCYLNYLEKGGKGIEKYIEEFSRYAVNKIRMAFKCGKIKKLLDKAYEYTRLIIESLQGTNTHVVLLRGELVTRLVIHMRSPQMPLEIGLSWDPYLNLPYIPSTTLKGVVRSYFEANNIRIGEYDSNKLFGSNLSEGLVIFYDSYPISCNDELIHPEVLTPHYREVEGKISEVEVAPTPIVYPTVAPGTIFYIPIAIKIESKNIPLLVDAIARALEKGIGAKTAIGYGYMRVTRL